MADGDVETTRNASVPYINNSFSSNPQFPEGLRVLAVDDNKVCLTLLTTSLKKCRYQVTVMTSKAEALALLNQNKDKFDIILTNVNECDETDGFKLLEAGLKLDIPVVMISAIESKDIVMKGVRHGADSYLIKPISVSAVQTIWQHVYRKQLRSLTSTIKGTSIATTTTVQFNSDANESMSKGGKMVKRKSGPGDGGGVGGVDIDINDNASKRERIKWLPKFHEKFLDAVEKLGGDERAVPKKILELMGEPEITREKVASHLQKHRKNNKKTKQCNNKNNNSNNKNTNNSNNNQCNQFSYPPIAVDSTTSMVHVPTGYYGNDQVLSNIYQRSTMLRPNYPHHCPGQLVGYQQPPSASANPSSLGFPAPQRMVPSYNGNFGSPGHNLLEQQQQLLSSSFEPKAQPQQLLSSPFEPKEQPPEELVDHGPSVVDPLYDSDALSIAMYDVGSSYPFFGDP